MERWRGFAEWKTEVCQAIPSTCPALLTSLGPFALCALVVLAFCGCTERAGRAASGRAARAACLACRPPRPARGAWRAAGLGIARPVGHHHPSSLLRLGWQHGLPTWSGGAVNTALRCGIQGGLSIDTTLAEGHRPVLRRSLRGWGGTVPPGCSSQLQRHRRVYLGHAV